jgi:hypothetical protein
MLAPKRKKGGKTRPWRIHNRSAYAARGII